VPNAEALKRYMKAEGIAAEEQPAAAARVIEAEINKYHKGGEFETEFPHRWLPAGLAIVDEAFTEQNGLVNSTMKIVRGKVETHFADRLDYLYTPEGKNVQNERNLASLAKLLK
jgi:long-chain acyl-CoA synthetase